MRIVHVVCSSGFAGVERSLTYVAPELARRGHDVTVIGGAAKFMAEPLAAAGVEFLPASSISDAIRALRSVSIAPVDVVHSHMTAADVASVLSRPKVRPLRVSTLHFAQPRGRTRLRRRMYRSLPAHLDKQVAISSFVASKCEVSTLVVPNGVPDPGLTSMERQPVVLMAQRLESEKQTDFALQAWTACPLSQQGWELHIAGDGSERTFLSNRIDELEIGKSVRLLGFVDDVPIRMARSSVLLATSPAEPFGLTVVEAMAAFLPVVAAAGGAHSEVLAGTGREYHSGDVAECAEALAALGADVSQRSLIARAQRSRYEFEFSVTRHVDRILSVYGECGGEFTNDPTNERWTDSCR